MGNKDSIFISAGDPSADFPGRNLIDEMRRVCPGLDVFGLGGPLMQAAGLTPLADHRQLAIMGFWEVAPRFFFFRDLLHRAAAAIAERQPKAIIMIDYPGFNLRLAKRVRHLGIPIIYYVSPQVWAWGKRRLKTIKDNVDLMLVIFPFEETFYRKHGVTARFTGHPIVDRFRSFPDKAACRAKVGAEETKRLIALLPGSRLQEVRRMLPVMVEAAQIIKREMREASFIVAGVADIERGFYENIIGREDLAVSFGMTPEIIHGADLVITSSGTATIETAYFATPMVIIYKTGFVTYQIARRLIALDVIGMVNIVAGKKIVPELIQAQANGPEIAWEAMAILGDPARYARMAADLRAVRDQLGAGDAARQAAAAIMEAARVC